MKSEINLFIFINIWIKIKCVRQWKRQRQFAFFKSSPKNTDVFRITSDSSTKVQPVDFHCCCTSARQETFWTGTCLMGVAHSLTHHSNTPQVQSLEIDSSFSLNLSRLDVLQLKIHLPFIVHLSLLCARPERRCVTRASKLRWTRSVRRAPVLSGAAVAPVATLDTSSSTALPN